MIPAKEFEGELWIKAADHNREVKRLADAEREACASLCFKMWNEWMDSRVGDQTLDNSNCPDAEDCAAAIRARGQHE